MRLHADTSERDLKGDGAPQGNDEDKLKKGLHRLKPTEER